MAKIVDIDETIRIRKRLKKENKTLVFTNGCFDIIHRGHIEYLKEAKSLGNILIVAVNSDSSACKIKGKKRPIVLLENRLFILSNFVFVDYLIVFEEKTPLNLIKRIIPDILVKGGDYAEDDIVGSKIVKENGGKVITIPYVVGKSSSNIIEKIISRYCKDND